MAAGAGKGMDNHRRSGLEFGCRADLNHQGGVTNDRVSLDVAFHRTTSSHNEDRQLVQTDAWRFFTASCECAASAGRIDLPIFHPYLSKTRRELSHVTALKTLDSLLCGQSAHSKGRTAGLTSLRLDSPCQRQPLSRASDQKDSRSASGCHWRPYRPFRPLWPEYHFLPDGWQGLTSFSFR